MRLLMLVNERRGIRSDQSTTALAVEVARRGVSWLAGVMDLSLERDGDVVFDALRIDPASPNQVVRELASAAPIPVRASELDAILIRTNPGRDKARTALHEATLNLCRIAQRLGVLVLNDPDVLPRASDKMFLTNLPETHRPRMLVSCDPERLRRFVEEQDGPSVLKPLFGTQGRGVFRVRAGGANLSALIEVLTAEGFVVAQQYLRRAPEGDMRVLLVDGAPLTVDGRVCAVHRVPCEGEFRSNIHLGGHAVPAVMKPGRQRAATAIGAVLAEHGVWMAGVDLIGSKAVEINVRSPGGLVDASEFEGVDFTAAVIDSIERRLTGAAV